MFSTISLTRPLQGDMSSESYDVVLMTVGYVRHFKRNVEAAYEWLADHYLPGDRIYLFGSFFDTLVASQAKSHVGFSRGAFQIRTLSGMIEKVCFLALGSHL